jgi:hypothetical protein
VADPADADVIRAVQRDAVPRQRAIGGGELVAARANVGGASLHLNVGRGVLASQADSRTRFIGEPLFCRSNLEAPRRQAGRLIAPSAIGCDRARRACADVLDCHRDIGKGRARLVRHRAGKARSRLGPRRERPHRKPQKWQESEFTHVH